MALDIHRKTFGGNIAVVGTPNLVPLETIEWDKRITFYHDDENGKVVFAFPKPPDDIPFVSFSKYIILESRYAKLTVKGFAKTIEGMIDKIPYVNRSDESSSIIHDLTNLAITYSLQGIVDFRLFPNESMKILMMYDIPLTEVNARVREVFGGEQSISSRIGNSTLNNEVEYKRIHIGPLVHGWTYRIGHVMPNSEPRNFMAKTDDRGHTLSIKTRGKEEDNERYVISDKIASLKLSKDGLSLDYMDLKIFLERVENKMDKLQVLYEKAVGAFSPEGVEEDEVDLELNRSSTNSILDKIYKELEIAQNEMIVTQTKIFTLEEDINRTDKEIRENSESLRRIEDKLSDALIKMQKTANLRFSKNVKTSNTE